MSKIGRCINNWREITNNKQVLEWVEFGVKVPFTTTPPACEYDNRQFTDKEGQFIESELNRLLSEGSIVECKTKPRCVTPISVVPKSSGDFRLVHDLRHINKYCDPPKFSYTDINVVLENINHQDNLVTVDLKSAFNHVGLHVDQHTFFGFQFNKKYYVSQVLVFGLNYSPYVFNKILRPIIEHLALQNIRCVAYVDDFIHPNPEDQIRSSRDYILQLLIRLGWSINIEKSSLTPETRKTFIGFVIDTAKRDSGIWLEIPKKRIGTVKKDIGRALKHKSISARNLARIAGQIISMSKAIIPAKLLLRNTYRLLKQRQYWSDILVLDFHTESDLKWWFGALDHWNGRFIADSPCSEKIQIATDASKYGWGCTIVNTNHHAQGYWKTNVSKRSSNFREMSAVLLSLQSLGPALRGKTVQILTDSVTTAAYVNFQGGIHADLSDIATKIWITAIKFNLSISAKWLAGKLNTTADRLSRLDNKSNWALHPYVYRHLDGIWGPHTIDRFACMNSTKCPRYNSRFIDPYTSGVDALFQNDWGQENNFVNPPIRLLPKVIKTIDSQKATATVIAPVFKAHAFFQALVSRSISPPILLPKPHLLCIRLGRVAPEPWGNRKWKFFAWRIRGKQN